MAKIKKLAKPSGGEDVEQLIRTFIYRWRPNGEATLENSFTVYFLKLNTYLLCDIVSPILCIY